MRGHTQTYPRSTGQQPFIDGRNDAQNAVRGLEPENVPAEDAPLSVRHGYRRGWQAFCSAYGSTTLKDDFEAPTCPI